MISYSLIRIIRLITSIRIVSTLLLLLLL